MNDDGLKTVIALMFVVGLVVCVLAFGCTDEPTAKRVLKQAGYSDVQMTGLQPASCGRGDWYATGFRAKSQSGDTVDGVVCSGLFLKYSTIRLR